MIRPATGFIVHVAAATVAAAAIVFAAAAWRLASGPVSLSFLTPYVQDALRETDSPYQVEFADTILTWAGWERTLDIRILDVRAVGPEGAVAATAPEVSIGLSVPALLRGMVAPTSLEIIEPKVRVVRDTEGRIELGLGESPDAASDPVELLLADLLAPPDPARTMGYIKRVSIVDADLTLVDRRLDMSWHAPGATITFSRDGTGIAAVASLDLEVAGHTARFDARGRYNSGDGGITVNVSFVDVQPEWFARDAPHLAPLAAARFPVSGSLDFVLGAGDPALQMVFDLGAGAGTLVLGEWFDHDFDVAFARAKGELAVGGERLRLDDLFIDFGGPKIAAQGLIEGLGGAPLIDGDVTVTDLPIDQVDRYWPREIRPNVRDWIAANRSGGIIRKALASIHIRPPGAVGPWPTEEALTASLELEVGGHVAQIDAHARYSGAEGGMIARVEFTDLHPEWFAGTGPLVVPLAAARFPVDGSLDVVLDPDAVVSQVVFDLVAGAGVVELDGWFDNGVGIASVQAKGVLEVGPERLRLDEVLIDLGGPKIAAQAWIEGFNRTPFISADATVTDLAVDDLARYWPRNLLPEARQWITTNVRDGFIRKAQTTVHLRPEDLAGERIPEEAVRIRFNLEGVTVHYQRPLPPVAAVNGIGTITGSTADLAVSSGQLDRLNVEKGQVSIADLWGSAPTAVDVTLSGPLRAALDVLAHPHLAYAQEAGIDPAQVGGAARAELRFEFPLSGESLTVTGSSILQDVTMTDAFDGYTLSNGALSLRLLPGALDVWGTAWLNGVPGALTWRENLVPGAADRSRFTFQGRFSDAQRLQLGMPGNELISGPTDVEVEIVDFDQERRRWQVTADLRDAAVRLPGVHWSKDPGEEGILQLEVRTAPGQPMVIDRFQADAGDLTASGRAELEPGGGLRFLEFSQLAFGETNLRVMLVPLEGAGYSINLTGPSFDLRPYLGDSGVDAGGDDDALPPLTITTHLDRVVINDRQALGDVNAVLGIRDGRWEAINAEAKLANGSTLALQLGGGGTGRVLQMTADDAGAALRAFDIFDNMVGGRLLLAATLEGAGADDVITGELRIDEHRLVNAPLLAKILSVASLTGIIDLLRGEGLPFRKLIVPFTKRTGLVHINDARSYGSALGITIEGRVDLVNDSLDLNGTLVPAYALNSALGFLPVIGDILVGPTGGGVFAATYRLSGPMDNPKIRVNPLAALAPGVLRKLFFFLDGRDSGNAG